jgi:hypothetical protein
LYISTQRQVGALSGKAELRVICADRVRVGHTEGRAAAVGTPGGRRRCRLARGPSFRLMTDSGKV